MVLLRPPSKHDHGSRCFVCGNNRQWTLPTEKRRDSKQAQPRWLSPPSYAVSLLADY